MSKIRPIIDRLAQPGVDWSKDTVIVQLGAGRGDTVMATDDLQAQAKALWKQPNRHLMPRKLYPDEKPLVVRLLVDALTAASAEGSADMAAYLQDGETPAECVARNRRDVDSMLSLLAAEKQRNVSASYRLRSMTSGHELIAPPLAAPADGAREWQDISTAPKDGTEIVALVSGRPYFVSWTTHGTQHAEAWWRDWEGYGLTEPTHWMPLPAPPPSAEQDK